MFKRKRKTLLVEERLPVKEVSLNHLFKKGFECLFCNLFWWARVFWLFLSLSCPVMIFEGYLPGTQRPAVVRKPAP